MDASSAASRGPGVGGTVGLLRLPAGAGHLGIKVLLSGIRHLETALTDIILGALLLMHRL